MVTVKAVEGLTLNTPGTHTHSHMYVHTPIERGEERRGEERRRTIGGYQFKGPVFPWDLRQKGSVQIYTKPSLLGNPSISPSPFYCMQCLPEITLL